MEWILGIDNAILDFIQQHLRSSFGDAVMPVITALGNAGIIWLLLGGGLLCFRKTRRIGAAVLAALAINLLLCNVILKPLVGRVRPFEANDFTGLLISPPSDPSFPSGHSSASFAAAVALFWYWKKPGVAALVLAALIAFSRLYLYVHYPTDVLAGALIGVLSALVACWLLGWAWKKREQNLAEK